MTKKRTQASKKDSFWVRIGYFFDRYPGRLLSAILFLALILRVMALLSLKESVYFDFLLWDERVYHNWAIKIANGIPVLSSYGFAPLPAYVMAFVYKILSPDIVYIRYVNILFGVLTCYLIYLIGMELANRTVGLFACLAASLYKPFIFYSIVPLKTSLSVLLFALTIYFFLAILNKHSLIKVLLIGIVIGLMLNVRPNCLVIIPLIPLIILWNIYKSRSSLKILTATIIIYIVGISIAITPFIIRNYRISSELKATTRQTGYALYMGNNLQNPDPYFRPIPFASSSPFEQGIQLIIEASRRAGLKLSPREAGSFWTHETMKIAMERPGAFVWKILQKILVFFNRFEAGDHYHIGFIGNFVKFFKLPFLSLWMILPFGMAGMVINTLGLKKSSALSLIFLFYASTLVLFYTSTRFRLPLLVILIPFAVMGIQSLFFYVQKKQHKQIVLYVAVVILFVVVEFLPVRGTDDMTPYYNTHAIILNAKGLEDEAIEYWERSSRMNRPCSASANLYLADKYFRRVDIQKAIYYLDKIPDTSFGASDKYEMLGDIMMHQGLTKKAITAYERSLDINSGRRSARGKLARVYWRIDKKKALEEYDKLEYISSFYPKRMT
ncbi:glycosyltransferase family 39 protein [Thermodesulfobacteriota bacterium]